jgi:XTP/dITP diphosphohydrolase
VTVYCATSNPGKLREFRLAGESLAGGRFSVETLPDLGRIEPPEETGSHVRGERDPEGAVLRRAHAGWLFVDDSGLEVDALGGAPGVQSARFAGAGAGDADNNALLLRRMDGVANRGAQFVCMIALAQAGKVVGTFRGVVRGRLIDAPRGPNGFGYDPLFFYEPFGCTFGEAAADAKMQVSHRAQALRAMFTWLSDNASSQKSDDGLAVLDLAVADHLIEFLGLEPAGFDALVLHRFGFALLQVFATNSVIFSARKPGLA